MKYILEAMPMNSRHRPLYFTNKRGQEWLSPHVLDAAQLDSKEKAQAAADILNENIRKHNKHFRVITISSSVIQRATVKR